MAQRSRSPSCPELPSHLWHTPAQRLTQTVPRSRRSREPSGTDQELNPGDRVEGLGNFGKPTGEFGTVERSNEEDAVVKWDDGRMRLHQPSLKKV
jgi:hypothetical protein